MGHHLHMMILKDNNEGMRCLFIFKRKKCICMAFQLDAAVPEKHLYFFLALFIFFKEKKSVYAGHFNYMRRCPRNICIFFSLYDK